MMIKYFCQPKKIGSYESMIPSRILDYSNACYFLREQHLYEKEIRQKKRIAAPPLYATRFIKDNNTTNNNNNNNNNDAIPLFFENLEVQREGEPQRILLSGKFKKRKISNKKYEIQKPQQNNKEIPDSCLKKTKKPKKKPEDEEIEEVETLLEPTVFLFDLIEHKWVEIECNYFLEPRFFSICSFF